MIVDGRGTPLAATLTAANEHDVKQLEPLVDAVPPVRGKRGHPRASTRASVRRQSLRFGSPPKEIATSRH